MFAFFPKIAVLVPWPGWRHRVVSTCVFRHSEGFVGCVTSGSEWLCTVHAKTTLGEVQSCGEGITVVLRSTMNYVLFLLVLLPY